MALTLIGIFDDANAANAARTQLTQAGIAPSAIQLKPGSTSTMDTTEHEDHRGFFARLFGLDEPDEQSGHFGEVVRRGSTALTVRLADQSLCDRATEIMERAGAIDVDQRVAAWREQGYRGYDRNAGAFTPEQRAKERETLRVIQEEIKVGKRQVPTGSVRVHRRVTEQPFSKEVTLHDEQAVVQRRAVDRPASAEELRAFDAGNRDVEIRETREEPVIEKAARVVEEVSIGKQEVERTEKVEDTVRRTDVDIDIDGGGEGTRKRY